MQMEHDRDPQGYAYAHSTHYNPQPTGPARVGWNRRLRLALFAVGAAGVLVLLFYRLLPH